MTMSYWDGVSWAPEPPPRPSDSRRRAPGKRWMLGLLAIGLIAALTGSASPSVLARTVSSMWTAPIGTGGANGTVAFRTYTDGTGSVYIGLRGLKPSTRYGAAITRGGCGTSGADLTAIPSFVTTSTGFCRALEFPHGDPAPRSQGSDPQWLADPISGRNGQPRSMRYVRASEGGACDHAGCDTHPVTDSHADARADPDGCPDHDGCPHPNGDTGTDHGAGADLDAKSGPSGNRDPGPKRDPRPDFLSRQGRRRRGPLGRRPRLRPRHRRRHRRRLRLRHQHRPHARHRRLFRSRRISHTSNPPRTWT